MGGRREEASTQTHYSTHSREDIRTLAVLVPLPRSLQLSVDHGLVSFVRPERNHLDRSMRLSLACCFLLVCSTSSLIFTSKPRTKLPATGRVLIAPYNGPLHPAKKLYDPLQKLEEPCSLSDAATAARWPMKVRTSITWVASWPISALRWPSTLACTCIDGVCICATLAIPRFSRRPPPGLAELKTGDEVIVSNVRTKSISALASLQNSDPIIIRKQGNVLVRKKPREPRWRDGYAAMEDLCF